MSSSPPTLDYNVWLFFYWIFYSTNLIILSTVVILSWPKIAIKCPDVSHSNRFSIIGPIVGGWVITITLQILISYQENSFNSKRMEVPSEIIKFDPLLPSTPPGSSYTLNVRSKSRLDFERVRFSKHTNFPNIWHRAIANLNSSRERCWCCVAIL